MAAPNMATITASLERSFQNCSLNNNQPNSGADESSGSRVLGTGSRSSSTSSSTPHRNHHDRHLQNANDTTLELNSHISLPYHWEQCLDLKTGEIYYINWRNGMKAKEDPRSTANHSSGGDYYYTEEEEEEEEEEGSYDSEESSSESSPNNCRRSKGKYANSNNKEEEEGEGEGEGEKKKDGVEEVLVVGGCKSCFMYFMLPKHVHDCPKCCGQLLHFDRSETASL